MDNARELALSWSAGLARRPDLLSWGGERWDGGLIWNAMHGLYRLHAGRTVCPGQELLSYELLAISDAATAAILLLLQRILCGLSPLKSLLSCRVTTLWPIPSPWIFRALSHSIWDSDCKHRLYASLENMWWSWKPTPVVSLSLPSILINLTWIA